MPPKKKKPAVSPIVVGTVSTRSTRRQSIVNIEIPKSSRTTAKSIQRTLKEAFPKTTDTNDSVNHTNKFKQTYNDIINYEDVESTSVKARVPKGDMSLSKTKGKLKSNKALLQILEDWTDDDSQDDKKDLSETESSDDAENVQELDKLIDREETNETNDDDNDGDMIGIQHMMKNESLADKSQVSDPVSYDNQPKIKAQSDMIESQHSTEDYQSIIEKRLQGEECFKQTSGSEETEEMVSQICETSPIETEEIIEEIIVEENETMVIDEPIEETVAFDESELIVECVTEEIISEEHDNQIVVMETTPIISDHNQEVKLKDSAVSCEDVEDKSRSGKISVPLLEKENFEQNEKKELVTENVILEETSQSVSTSDSNDAEVRGFFAKEIENNEIVKEEDIPNLEYEVIERNSSYRENIDSVTSVFEESFVVTDMATELEDTPITSEESVQEYGINSEDEDEQEIEIHGKKVIIKKRKCKKDSLEETIIKTENMSIGQHDDNFCTEESLKEDGTREIKKEYKPATDKFDEKMDTTDVKGEESLESKVAELHLKDEDFKEEEISENVDKLKINKLDEVEVKIDEGMVNEFVKQENEFNMKEKIREKMDELLGRQKTRRTRSDDMKSTKPQKDNEEQPRQSKSPKLTKTVKILKERKTLKPKEIKPKDIKSQKELKSKIKLTPTPAGRKTKEKDLGRNDKKDIVKKFPKMDGDQGKKYAKSDNTDSEDTEVRRSSRIKSISVLKKKTTGHGLVRSKSEPILNESDVSDSNSVQTESEKSTPSASPKVLTKERKTRWTRSSENLSSDSQSTMDSMVHKSDSHLSEMMNMDINEKPKLPLRDPVVDMRLKQFVHLKENMYKTDRMTCKEAKKMTCDCFLTIEEKESNEYGCGEDCLNRLLLIECGSLCQVGDRCTNKRFQKGQFAPVEVFNTEKKGLGLRAAANIPYGEFILEYVGEVLNCEEFDKRAEVYSQDKNIHYYFMSLRADAIIDATMKGNISRFINHSCDPNAETQKWTVNGELRIGFFSTRTILAGEEITFDYRFQRYGKEAQKCYCEASICRGWLGEQPDEDSEDEDEEEEEEEDTEAVVPQKTEVSLPVAEIKKIEDELKPTEVAAAIKGGDIKVEKEPEKDILATPVAVKRKSPRKKPRKDIFEDLDQLDEEIEMLVTTGLKNQAHTLKLSRLMVRAKEPAQRTKLLRILRRGELPCRRLFLDYHGLRLMHGYMIDAQHLVHTDKRYESIRLEMLQTLAVLPIPNKTMLQDSKVLPTVEKWSTDKDLGSPHDSDSNSPKIEQEVTQTPTDDSSKEKYGESPKKSEDLKKEGEKPERSIEDQEEEIRFLATKLLEGWTNLKEVFRIPKKERIEQMKEHEREANKKFMQSGYGGEHDSGRKSDRYRHLSRYKMERDSNRKGSKSGGKPSAEFIRLSKIERRKLFALQHELKEEERRLKQREMWRQHELNCLIIGTDPRFTAPFDPNRGYQCIWNPQIGQWQNYPLPPQNQTLFSPQPPTPSNINLPSLPNLSVPPPQLQIPQSIPSFPYAAQIGIPTGLNGGISQLPTNLAMPGQVQPPPPTSAPQMHIQQQMPNLPASVSQINSMQGIPGALPQNIPTHPQIPVSMPSAQVPVVQYQEQAKNEEDPSQVKFMGPIPPPVKLPPKWKCAKDKYGRPFYYHIRLRKSQWEPPLVSEAQEEPEESSESESSSDTSSVTSDTSSENSDSDDDIDDTRLLLEVRKQMEISAKLTLKPAVPDYIVKTEEVFTPSPDDKNSEDNDIEIDEDTDMSMMSSFIDEEVDRPSIDIRLKEQFDLLKDDKPPRKKRRVGLCEEIIISPRSEEDRLQFREDLKRYKANKERLKRQKDLILQQTRKQLRETEPKKPKEKRSRATVKSRIKEMPDFNSEAAKKIKENFRSNMASTVVGSLNAYRKPDCKEGKITNTEDFKHLARKLTHFVMLKEMKHIARIEDLTCTDNVKSKAREYIKKYMSKFGEVYIKRNDSPDFKD